jgi:hypothetical protein
MASSAPTTSDCCVMAQSMKIHPGMPGISPSGARYLSNAESTPIAVGASSRNQRRVAGVFEVARESAYPVEGTVGNRGGRGRKISDGGHPDKAVATQRMRSDAEDDTGPGASRCWCRRLAAHAHKNRPPTRAVRAGAVEERVGRAEIQSSPADLRDRIEAIVIAGE